MRTDRKRPGAPGASRRLPVVRRIDAGQFAFPPEDEMRPSPNSDRRAARGPTSLQRTLFLVCAGVVACLSARWIHCPIGLLYNPSASVARGWYLTVPATGLKVGMLVIARLPVSAARLAAARDYLPITVPVIKRIAARGGEHICERVGVLSIAGRPVARALRADSAGRPLPAWRGCRVLAMNELLLLGDGAADSYDSRYFGPITARAVKGRAIPLWTWR